MVRAAQSGMGALTESSTAEEGKKLLDMPIEFLALEQDVEIQIEKSEGAGVKKVISTEYSCVAPTDAAAVTVAIAKAKAAPKVAPASSGGGLFSMIMGTKREGTTAKVTRCVGARAHDPRSP